MCVKYHIYGFLLYFAGMGVLFAQPKEDNMKVSKATFGGGCFWCTEAVFDRLKGVVEVVSGYAGGRVPSPSYKQVVRGLTGHAEVVQVTYNPDILDYETLLEVFWKTHDPTTLNRQGNDVGTQYRSIILYHNPTQRALAEKYKQKLDTAGIYNNPIVTEIASLDGFYKADISHQDYYRNNPNAPYCRFVIQPKIDKFEKVFSDRLKRDRL